MLSIHSPTDLEAWKGKEFGVSEWIQITAEMIGEFAQSTGDFQWIHLDATRCQNESPFGKPVAHGFLILSLIPRLYYQSINFPGAKLTLNYGLNKVRFISPVPVDSFIRARFFLQDFLDLEKGYRIFSQVTFELQEATKPVCIAESILQVMNI